MKVDIDVKNADWPKKTPDKLSHLEANLDLLKGKTDGDSKPSQEESSTDQKED